jgi:hypothetical protein
MPVHTRSARCHIPEHSIVHSHHSENLKPYMYIFIPSDNKQDASHKTLARKKTVLLQSVEGYAGSSTVSPLVEPLLSLLVNKTGSCRYPANSEGRDEATHLMISLYWK